MSITVRRAIRNALCAGCALAAGAGSPPSLAEAPAVDFRLQILHASDLEGGVEAIKRAPGFAAVVERLEQQAAAASPAIPSVFLSAGDNWAPGPFFSASGDATLRAPLRNACAFAFGQSCAVGSSNVREGAGRVDVMVMSILGVDASALGNHEFDLGTGVVLEAIGSDIRSGGTDPRWYGTPFPYLSSNLDFSADANLSPLFESAVRPSSEFVSSPAARVFTKKIAPATTIEVTYDGKTQKVGVVGATTPLLESISSPGGVTVKDPGAGTNDMALLAQILRPVIDDVRDGEDDVPGTGDDINKVILITHLQQLDRELALAPLLGGIDVLIAGGSDTRLADGNDLLGSDPSEGAYPQVATNADGDPVLVVSTDGQYSYVGRLVVEFDAGGLVLGPLTPETASDPNLNGAFASSDAVVEDLWGNLTDPFADATTKGDAVRDLVTAVQGVVNAKDGAVKGETAVYIEGRRERVRTEETNLGNLSADANLAYARAVDPTTCVSIKNGGGIRNPIGETVEDPPGSGGYVDVPPRANPDAGKQAGQVSQLDIENSLRFNNQLTLVTATADELRRLVEHGVAATAPGATPGQFPQVGGIAFSFDPDLAPGQRVRSLAITNDAGVVTDVVVQDGRLMGDPRRRFRIVTLNFLAGGGDNYPFPALARPERVDTGKGEQAALADLLAAEHPPRANPADPQPASAYGEAETPAAEDTRIQNLNERASDTVLAGVRTPAGLRGAVNGTAAADVLAGGVGTNAITTGDGADRVLFSSPRDGLDVITDFTVGQDRIVLTQLLRGIGYRGTDPLGDGTVQVRAEGASSLLLVDPDRAGPGRGVPLARLLGVAPAALESAGNFEL